ncbi:MAG: hypothetical protein M3065_06795 [Actinomycetota bacterium]|nr:hypothetical protein [Actinomycetota bacterium]
MKKQSPRIAVRASQPSAVMRFCSRMKKRTLLWSGVLALGIACLAPAAAMASYTSVGVGLYSSPSPYKPNGQATLPYWNIAMYCWTDSPYRANGSNRWFSVYGTGWSGANIGFISGFIPANYVKAQTRVKHC